RGAHHARHLRFAEDGRGGVKVTGYGTVEDAEAIKTVLHPLAAPVTTEPGACGGVNRTPGQAMFDEHGLSTQQPCLTPGCGHDGTDPREAGARLWDALVDACHRLANSDDLPRDHGTRPRVMVLIDQQSLRQQVIDAGLAREGQTPTGARLSATAVRRMACDAEIIPTVLGTESQVLDVGRTHRLVTPALWTALIARDRHCAFPGCTRMPLACDAHHITHWADGGPTALSNLVMLCRHHHTLIHQTPWIVKID
uniref:HNH endonuclease signature motif containing protein n=1 Tax=Nocardioides sp. BYT-33-1 TaxID=3416952 RepID=UPI003F539207